MRISDWSSDVCSSDLQEGAQRFIEERHEGEKERPVTRQLQQALVRKAVVGCLQQIFEQGLFLSQPTEKHQSKKGVYHCRLDLDEPLIVEVDDETAKADHQRSEEHTSELQSLMRISYAVFCLKKQ